MAASGATAFAGFAPSILSAEGADARERWLELLGPFPTDVPPLNAEVVTHESIEGIARYHVRFATEGDDTVTAWLLVPPARDDAPRPVVMCPHSTTQGAGKDRIIGLCGATHEDPPDAPEGSRAYGLELARWGYVTLSMDLMCDGERVPPGLKPYNSNVFYEAHPEWSMVGKSIWDLMRCVDFLHTLPYVDRERIACLGHSLGGHTSLFAGAFDSRIAAVVSNGGQLSWVRDTDHWSRPPDPSGRSVRSYTYIKGFRPYIEDPDLDIPVNFAELMGMMSPRPLLIMGTEAEATRDQLSETISEAISVHGAANGRERITLFTYPGAHNYPPVAKRFSFAWLDRWLGHRPAVETIWPGSAI